MVGKSIHKKEELKGDKLRRRIERFYLYSILLRVVGDGFLDERREELFVLHKRGA